MIIKLILVFLVSFSCSMITKRVSHSSKDVIEFDSLESKKINLSIEEENDTSSYGPSFKDIEEEGEVLSSKDIIGVFWGPGLYLTYSYLALYKYFESLKHKPLIQACLGHSCLLMMLYMKYQNSSMVEWKLFELWKKLSPLAPYESSWNKVLIKFIKNEFQKTRIESYSGVNIFYLWNDKRNKLYSLTEGDSVWVLKHTLLLNTGSDWKNALMTNYIPSPREMKKKGASKVIKVSVLSLPEMFNFKDDYIFGLYSRYLGQKSKESDTIVFDLGLLFDERENFPLILTRGEENLLSHKKVLEELMKF